VAGLSDRFGSQARDLERNRRGARGDGAGGLSVFSRLRKLTLLEPARSRGALAVAATDVTNIARSLISAPASGDSYWAETARGLFAGLLGYVLDSETMEGERTIKSALKLFSRVEVWPL